MDAFFSSLPRDARSAVALAKRCDPVRMRGRSAWPEEPGDHPIRHAVEIRHDSFRDPAFIDLARERNMAIVFADSDEFPCIDEQTADFTYARLQRSQDDVETGYDDRALDKWAKQAREWAKGDRDVYIFFIAGAKVRNPAAAQALIAKL